MSYSSNPSLKRRASTIAGDRVMKAMRREPQDGATPTESSFGIPPPMLPSPHLSYLYPISDGHGLLNPFAERSAASPQVSSASTLSGALSPSFQDFPAPLPFELVPDAIPHLIPSISGTIPVEPISTPLQSPNTIRLAEAASVSPHRSVRNRTRISTPWSNSVPVAGSSTLRNNIVTRSPTYDIHLQQAPLTVAFDTPSRPSRPAPTSDTHVNPSSRVLDRVSHSMMDGSTAACGLLRTLPSACDSHHGDFRHSDDQAAQEVQDQRQVECTSPPNEDGRSLGLANEVPQEYQDDVERIFLEFLSSVCSNVGVTDAQGDAIHQTFSAKIMERLDESIDFRPFKFRIQPFTNAFMETIRNFLWNHPYIARFNKGGNRSKSKGIQIWNVDAKRTESGWTFRSFGPKLTGPPDVAYVGLPWTWSPSIWDPHVSLQDISVSYSSTPLPSWLAWKRKSITGIPPSGAQNFDITVQAKFTQDGKEVLLTHTAHIFILPLANIDPTVAPTRRPGRRSRPNNDVPLPPPAQRLTTHKLLVSASAAPVVTLVQTIQVLIIAIQAVGQDMREHVVASHVGPELRSLVKQQRVLVAAAQAVSSNMTSDVPEGDVTHWNTLTVAAIQVVLHAARQLVADCTFAMNAAPQIAVEEVSAATRCLVAQAVQVVGPLSGEVDVLQTAASLFLSQILAKPSPIDQVHRSTHGANEFANSYILDPIILRRAV